MGIKLRVLEPGQPNGLYNSENQQEAFLVLSGECGLLVGGEERLLVPWDFFHNHAARKSGAASNLAPGDPSRTTSSHGWPKGEAS